MEEGNKRKEKGGVREWREEKRRRGTSRMGVSGNEARGVKEREQEKG